jgi:hypothetical protein
MLNPTYSINKVFNEEFNEGAIMQLLDVEAMIGFITLRDNLSSPGLDGITFLS